MRPSTPRNDRSHARVSSRARPRLRKSSRKFDAHGDDSLAHGFRGDLRHVQQIFFGPRDGCVLDVGNAKSLSKRRPFGKLFRASGELARKASSSPQRSPLIVSLTSRPKVPPIKPVVPTRSASEPAANYPAAELELPPAPGWRFRRSCGAASLSRSRQRVRFSAWTMPFPAVSHCTSPCP